MIIHLKNKAFFCFEMNHHEFVFAIWKKQAIDWLKHDMLGYCMTNGHNKKLEV